jgi:ATP-dependent helicase/DNAse subunit B
MEKGTLFIAPPGARNKREVVFKEIVSRYPENNYSSVLYLTPNSFVISEVRARFFSYIKKHNNRSTYIPFQLLTIKQLATELYETSGECDIISDRVRTLILCELLKDRNIGYARQLAELFRKFRHYILDKELPQLKEEICQIIFEEKARDRAVKAIEILQSYEDVLKKRSLIDLEDVLKASIPLIKEYPDKAGNIDILVIDGFYDPTPLELEIIKTLINKVVYSYILVEEGTELYRFLQASDFKFSIERLSPVIYRKNIGYYTYSSMEDEVEGIARLVKKLLIEGVEPCEIIVSFPVLSKYLSIVRRVFNKYGIPVSTGEENLSASAPVVFIEEIISCMDEDYPRTAFLSLLTSPYAPAIADVVKKLAVTFSYRAGVVKGKDSWLSIEEVLKNTVEELLDEEKNRIREFQKGIKQVINIIEDIKRVDNPSDFLDAFETALEKFGFFDALDHVQSGMMNEISRRISEQFSELRQFAVSYKSSRGTEHFGFYLRYMFQDLKYTDNNQESIRVIPYELVAGLEIGELFFGGMLEGDFPSRPGIDPILPEKVKKTLGLPYLEYYLNRQRQYFKRLLNVSSSEPYFSYPSADGDKVFLPSPFLEWERIITPPPLNIFTEEEILIAEGSTERHKLTSEIFWSEELTYDKDAYRILSRRIGILSRDYINVTDIDYYRKCPLRFYIEKILGLEVEIPPRFEVEAKLWGRLAHRTMEYLFKKDRDIELTVLGKKLFEALEISLGQFKLGDFWAGVAREIFRKLIPMLTEQETAIRMQGFIPYKVEEKIKVEINNLKLMGKIDRIDRKVNGTDNGHRERVILLDYKTGTVDGNSLQLPLYAGMWQKQFSHIIEKAGYYSLKDGKVRWYPAKKISMDEFIQVALQDTEELVKNMKRGVFVPVPDKPEECRYCYHSSLCDK